MGSMSFTEVVSREFWYLTSEYGFSKKEHHYESGPYDDAMVEFRSPSTIIIIQLVRGEVLDRIGPLSEPEIGWSSIEKLVEFLTQGNDVSLTDSSKRNQYNFEGWIEHRVSNYAGALQKYCREFLQGNFSRWLAFQKWFLKQMEDDYRAMTGLEFPQNQRYVKYIKTKELNEHHK